MNTNILSKCVEELKKDNPNISYVLGMLETVIEMGNQTSISVPYTLPYNPPMNPLTPSYPVYVSANSTGGSGLVAAMTDEEIMAQKYNGGTTGNLS